MTEPRISAFRVSPEDDRDVEVFDGFAWLYDGSLLNARVALLWVEIHNEELEAAP